MDGRRALRASNPGRPVRGIVKSTTRCRNRVFNTKFRFTSKSADISLHFFQTQLPFRPFRSSLTPSPLPQVLPGGPTVTADSELFQATKKRSAEQCAGHWDFRSNCRIITELRKLKSSDGSRHGHVPRFWLSFTAE